MRDVFQCATRSLKACRCDSGWLAIGAVVETEARNASAMSLSGKGVVAIWNGIREDTRADFFEWHNREHMPERVAIRGFRRGRRFTALDAQPEFFTLYETDDAKTLTGADYLARLDNPTPWTRRVTAAFLNTSRSLCRVARSLGPGEGGLMMTFRFEVADGRDGE